MMTRSALSLRLLACLLALTLLLPLTPGVSARDFDPEACAAHAEENYLNGSYGLCAQFASMCLYYGGLSCAYNSAGNPYVSCAALRDSLLKGGVPEYQVVLREDGIAYQEDNLITRGDVVFWVCDNLAVHGHVIYPHAAICQGPGKDGRLLYCARNNSSINHKLNRMKCYGCGKVCQTIVGLHPGPETGSFQFTVYKDGVPWGDSPALASAYMQREETGAVYPLYRSRSTSNLYLTRLSLPKGDYALWVDRGDGVLIRQGVYALEGDSAAGILEYFTLRFRGNGSEGNGAPPNRVLLKEETVTLPAVGRVIREGYDLAGWSDSPTGLLRYAPGAEYVFTGSSTLYALWIPRITPRLELYRQGTPLTDCPDSFRLRREDSVYPLAVEEGNRYRTAGQISQGTYALERREEETGEWTDTGLSVPLVCDLPCPLEISPEE